VYIVSISVYMMGVEVMWCIYVYIKSVEVYMYI